MQSTTEIIDPSNIEHGLAKVRGQIFKACERVGRDPQEVHLVAVCKTCPAEVVRAAMGAGQLIFGENRVQEAKAKIPLVPRNARWHLIGHLQKNKIRMALPLFEMLHGVDSLELAQEINRVAGEMGLYPKVLIQANVSGETSKYGFTPDALMEAADTLLGLERLEIHGLMTMAPIAGDPEEARPHFRNLRLLRDAFAQAARAPMPHLSMGMSGDFEVAVEEGATLVRVGSAIFGSRKSNQ